MSLRQQITLSIYFLPKLIAATKASRPATDTAGARDIPDLDRRSSLESTDATSFNWRIKRKSFSDGSKGEKGDHGLDEEQDKEQVSQVSDINQAPPDEKSSIEESNKAVKASTATKDRFVWHVSSHDEFLECRSRHTYHSNNEDLSFDEQQRKRRVSWHGC